MSGSVESVPATFDALRPRLVGVAYGLLGSVTEAEDVVQDAWIRLQRTDYEEIDDLTGWLVTTTSRLALDVLRSARHRREAYVGPWLPEPVETAPDPADSVTLAESVSWAMMVVLETLSPAERTAFVLHDLFGLSFDEIATALGRSPAGCRKLASRARAHIDSRTPRFDVDPTTHHEVVEAFADAATTGDLEGLLQILDPSAVLTATVVASCGRRCARSSVPTRSPGSWPVWQVRAVRPRGCVPRSSTTIRHCWCSSETSWTASWPWASPVAGSPRSTLCATRRS